MSTPISGSSASVDNPPLINTYVSYLEKLKDPLALDHDKIEAIRELGENFDLIVAYPQYPSFLATALKIILKILQEGVPHFIAESSNHQIRRLLLELIHRIPVNIYLEPHIDSILALTFEMLTTDNEQVVSICLKIIIELHKQKRAVDNEEIKVLLHYICKIYQDLPSHLDRVFQPKTTIHVHVSDLSEVDLNTILKDIYTVTPIHWDKVLPDGTTSSKIYNVIPRGIVSLKVLQELPFIVGKVYELYKENVKNELNEYITLSVQSISLQPTEIYGHQKSYNKEAFVDFLVAQIKTIAFLAHMLRVPQESVEQHAQSIVKGILGILSLCPPELTGIRRDLLVATRGILATNSRMMFLPYIDQLFEEDVLLGRGWTTHEALRPLAYTTLADFINNLKLQLQFRDLARAIHLLSKNLHDETLPTSIQTASCEVLVNLVDCVRQHVENDATLVVKGRNLYFRVLEVFVLKFKTIAKLQLPAKCKLVESKNMTIISISGPLYGKKEKYDSAEISGKAQTPSNALVLSRATASLFTNIADCRNLVKCLVNGVKAISSRLQLLPTQDSRPRETEMFIRFLKWGLQALDIYSIVSPQSPLAIRAKGEQMKSKEEKEVMEHFAGVFSVMNPLTFKAVFSSTIDFMIDRVSNNFSLQTIGNSFLTTANTSSIFITILVEYLLERMPDMGKGDVERGTLYLKLFKLVFESICVSQCRAANVQTLRPYVQKIVTRTLELAVTSKESVNYFILLRTLFKYSKSSGANQEDEHSPNLLHVELVPLLPRLLQALISFQSGQHQQHMKNLFIELCLTIPVSLGSLLVYLPMLMSPLVYALQGSPSLISQALLTLEQCVDNPLTDFLRDNVLPMRVELIQALWRCLRHPMDRISLDAFRILGKFGGGNRKVLLAPQKLDYRSESSLEPSISVHFSGMVDAVDIPIVKVIETAVTVLRQPDVDVFYKRKSWEIVRDFLVITMNVDLSGRDEESAINYLKQSYASDLVRHEQTFRCPNRLARNTCINALIGLFYGLAIKGLAQDVQLIFQRTVRHFILVALFQQIGSQASLLSEGMDGLVIVDAVADIMGNEEKAFCKIGKSALSIIIDTVTLVVGSKDAACQLPLMECVAEEMYHLCYNRAWFAKLGGCIATRFLMESISLRWALHHLLVFIKALFFVLVDLTGDISNGAVDEAKANLHAFLELCVNPCEEPLRTLQNCVLKDVIAELQRKITNPIEIVRDQAMYALNLIAGKQNRTVYDVMEPCKARLLDIVLPKKIYLRHLTPPAQIGLLEGYTFCFKLTPRLFPEDESKTKELREKEEYLLGELMVICRREDALPPLRKAAMRSLSAGNSISGPLNDIFDVFYQCLKSSDPEIQETAFESLKNSLGDTILKIKDPLLFAPDENNIVFSLSEARRLSYMIQLFPDCFTESVCERWACVLQNMMLGLSASAKNDGEHTEKERVVTAILGTFHQMPAAGPKFIEPLMSWVFQTEINLHVTAYSPFRVPLVKFLLRHPKSTIAALLGDNAIKNPLWNDFLGYLIKSKDGKPFRDLLQTPEYVQRLIILASSANKLDLRKLSHENQADELELRFQSVRIVSSLVKFDEKWLSDQHQLAQTFIDIWCNDSYQVWHSKIEGTDHSQWKEPKLIVRILLNYFSHEPSNFLLLFQILRAFCYRFIPDFRFVKRFLDETVSQGYSVDWKRLAFLKFAELFPSEQISQELKAKILQFVIIPCFNQSFKKNEGKMLIGGLSSDPLDSPGNIISVFISKVIGCKKPAHGDAVKVYLFNLSCIFIEHAFPFINDPKVMPSDKLQSIMNYAGPCLLTSNCTNPATRYHGHLLFCHIIAKKDFPSNNYKQVVLKVFCNLLKAHALEVRMVVRQALDIITPALSSQLEDGHVILTQWTKKILVEGDHNSQQLAHVLQLIVRQHNIYYPVRHALVQRMISAVLLSLKPSSSIENKKLGCELADVIIQWEARRLKESCEERNLGLKRSAPDDPPVSSKKGPGTSLGKLIPDKLKPLEKNHADTLVNYLMYFACYASDVNAKTSTIESQGEIISRRCCILVRKALSQEIWPQYKIDFRLNWMNSLFCTMGLVKNENLDKPVKINVGNVCKGLELFTLALSVMDQETAKFNCKLLQKGIIACLTCSDLKVIASTRELLSRLMSVFPIQPSIPYTQHEQLELVYSTVAQVIIDGISNYERTGPSNTIFTSVMILDAACSSNPCYIDIAIDVFVRVICKMCDAQPDSSSELLVCSLKLVKDRIGVMSLETRSILIDSILGRLIETTKEEKVMKAILLIVGDLVLTDTKPDALNSNLTHREKSMLLDKLAFNVEDRFSNLQVQFLEFVNVLLRDEKNQTAGLTLTLQPAFLAGLRCPDPTIRMKFFDNINESIEGNVYDRLSYIICHQKWEMMANHYWIKQCVELLLYCASDDLTLRLFSKSVSLPRLPTLPSTIPDSGVNLESHEEAKDSNPKVANFLHCISQLCHIDSSLAGRLWLDLFPRLWSLLMEVERKALTEEIQLFVVSGSHEDQNGIDPNAFRTFFEGIALCEPPIPMKPSVMTFVGKSLNLWHLVTLSLEKIVSDQWYLMMDDKFLRFTADDDDFECMDHAYFQNKARAVAVEHLTEMYSRLKEEDMWCAIWQEHARYKETSTALAFEGQGFFEQALGYYDAATTVAKHEYYSSQLTPEGLMVEQRLCERQSISCHKELGRWRYLLHLGRTKGFVNPFLIMECAWRIPDWERMGEAVGLAETACPKDLNWKTYLHRGYRSLVRPAEDQTDIDSYVQTSSSLCIEEWRKLPRFVSYSHIPLLQAAQQIRELQEAHQVYLTLNQKSDNYLQDVNTILKTWGRRLPVMSDHLSHWSDVLTWRQIHYETIARHGTSVDAHSLGSIPLSAFAVHESVQALIQFGKVARKHNLINLCEEALARIERKKEVHVSDLFQSARQLVKSYVHKATIGMSPHQITEGLKTVQSIEIKFFTKEMTAEMDALKGMLLARLDRDVEAEKTFSASASAVPELSKTWALWGDFCESQLVKSKPLDMSYGVRAVECFLHACRHQNESKTRKYLTKVIWLLSYDDKDFKISQAVARKVIGIPVAHWVPWIPQLLTCLTRDEGEVLEELINKVGKSFPQAVYFPLRTLYLTLKIKRNEDAKQACQSTDASNKNLADLISRKPFTPASKRCFSMIKLLRDEHPTTLTALDSITYQLGKGLENNWCEDMLRRLRSTLTTCYSNAFENRGSIRETTVPTNVLHFFKTLVDSVTKLVNERTGIRTKRAEVLQEIVKEFSSDFTFETNDSKNLLNLILKLEKWDKKLDEFLKTLLPKSFLIEERTIFFMQFAEIDLPGEYLAPKHSHHRVKISSFLPKVEIVYKHNMAARTLFIRGNNGRIYPYLVLNDSGVMDANREERMLQLFRMINQFLVKNKETSRRFLRFTVPRVVAVSPHTRLVEENRSSLSLLDVYKEACQRTRYGHSDPIAKYYDRIKKFQERQVELTHQILRDIFSDVQSEMIPKTLLKDWAERTYKTASNYWTFRKTFTHQMALACFSEYVLRMTRLNPEMLYIHRDSGLVNVSFFKFDIEDSKRNEVNQRVVFRMTPNIQELITETGIAGPLTASMIACARCLVYPNFKVNSIIRAILRDEIISYYSNRREDNVASREDLIGAVSFFTESINQRLHKFAKFDNAENNVTPLMIAATNKDNLCRMDPAWNPWL